MVGLGLWRCPYWGVYKQCKTALSLAGMQWAVEVAILPWIVGGSSRVAGMGSCPIGGDPALRALGVCRCCL